MTTEETTTPSFYEEEDNLRKLCDFLRSGDGPPVREALLMEKRVYYLKGRSNIDYDFFFKSYNDLEGKRSHERISL